MTRLYLYALTDAPPSRPGRGLGGERLRTVELDWGFAVGEPVSRPPAVTARTVRAHDAVVRRLARQVGALLPCRFGTILEEGPRLRRSLGKKRRALATGLARVRGLEQMTVRVFAGAGRRPTPAADRGAGPGTRYLLAARRAHDERMSLLAPLRAALGPRVRAEIVEEHSTLPLVATVHHLIPRGGAPRYRAILRGAARGSPVRVRITGPLPPYAFSSEWLA